MLLDPPDDGKEAPQGRTKGVVHLIPTLEKTAAQVAILRGIVDTASQFVTPQRSQFTGEVTEGLDKESAEAARKTLILAFHQLDNIIEEQPRWNLDEIGPEADARQLIKAEVSRVSADAKLKEAFSQPFYMLRAQLYRLPDGRVLAADPQRAVTAHGKTPREAVDAFNRAFDEMVDQYASEVEGPPKTPTPKKTRKPRPPKP